MSDRERLDAACVALRSAMARYAGRSARDVRRKWAEMAARGSVQARAARDAARKMTV